MFAQCGVAGQLVVRARGITHTFTRLAELPFDSFRKCMSVIVRDIDGVIHVLSKGAETAMFQSCLPSQDQELLSSHCDTFASLGLRHQIVTSKKLH